MKRRLRVLLLLVALFASIARPALAFGGDFAVSSSETGTSGADVDVPITGESVSITAEQEALAFQWQIRVLEKPVELWANIHAETDQTLELTYAMVCNLLDEDGRAYVRCMAQVADDVDMEYSETLSVGVDETIPEVEPTETEGPEEDEEKAMPAGSDEPEGSEEPEEPAATDDAEEAAPAENTEPVQEEVPEETPEEIPEFVPEELPEDVPADGADEVETLVLTDLSYSAGPGSAADREDGTYVATVHHYYQDLDGVTYHEGGTTERTVEADKHVTVSDLADDREGFYAVEFGAFTMDSDVTVDVYYDRYYYLLYLDLDGGYGVDATYARYGTDLSELAATVPEKAGYLFDGWQLDRDMTDEGIASNLQETSLPGQILAGMAAYRATWRVSDSSFTVVYWLQNADDDDYSVLGTRTVDVGTESTVRVADYAVAPTALEQRLSLSDEFRTLKLANYIQYDAAKTRAMNDDSDTVTVAGDRSTVVNVCYTRNSYTLKFYYAISAGERYYVIGGSTYYFGANASISDKTDEVKLLDQYNNTSLTLNSSKVITHRGQVKTLPTLKTSVRETGRYTEGADTSTVSGTAYQYHYITFTARYGADISGLWPCDVFDPVEISGTGNQNYKYATVSAWNGEYNVYYTQANASGNQTIKGKYSQLDYQLLWKSGEPTDGTVSYLCFWENGAGNAIGWSIPELYRYRVWVPTLEGQDPPEDAETYERDGVTYYLYEEYDTCDNSTVSEQTAPAIPGFTYLSGSMTSQNLYGTETTLTQEELETYKTLYSEAYAVNFFYTRNAYHLTFISGGQTEIERGGTILFGASIARQTYTPQQPDDLEHGAYVFDGWYTSSVFADGTAFRFDDATMPANNLVLYAKWMPKKHTVTFYGSKDDLGDPDRALKVCQVARRTALSAQLDEDDQAKLADRATYPGNDGTKTDYSFVGWFYLNDGVENMFTFDLPVSRDLDLYPRWSTNKQAQYTVYYKLAGTDIDVADPTTGYALVAATKILVPKDVSELYAPYDHYVTAPAQNGTLEVRETRDGTVNTYTFWYTENTVTLQYAVVGPAGCGTVSTEQEDVALFYGTATGSAPQAAAGYRFVGWFLDEDCTEPVPETWVQDDVLVPEQTTAHGDLTAYEDETYYAAFERDIADLTITKKGRVRENDTFVFDVREGDTLVTTVTITGTGSITVEGLLAGTVYTVTERTDWSWRYASSCDHPGGQVTLARGGSEIIFTNTPAANNWLSGAAAAVNRWTNGTVKRQS